MAGRTAGSRGKTRGRLRGLPDGGGGVCRDAECAGWNDGAESGAVVCDASDGGDYGAGEGSGGSAGRRVDQRAPAGAAAGGGERAAAGAGRRLGAGAAKDGSVESGAARGRLVDLIVGCAVGGWTSAWVYLRATDQVPES